MTSKRQIQQNRSQDREGHPFAVPGGYFESFGQRLKARLDEEEAAQENPPAPNWLVRTRPYLALAAAISAVALITFTLLHVVTLYQGGDAQSYDMALLEETGVLNNEHLIMETLELAEEDGDAREFTEWEEEAMNYLASNDVELELLINDLNEKMNP